MIKLSQLTSVTVVLLVAGISASGAASNPLIGKWTLTGPGYIDRDGNNYCDALPEMDFTATTQTMFAAATKFRPAAQGSTPVFYLVSGNKVYVSATQGFFNAPDYIILAPNKMQTDTVGHCVYQKN
jgi:hypothetical protein